jgi:hypothetical protein
MIDAQTFPFLCHQDPSILFYFDNLFSLIKKNHTTNGYRHKKKNFYLLIFFLYITKENFRINLYE